VKKVSIVPIGILLVLCAASAGLASGGEILLTFEGAAVETMTVDEFLALPQITVELTRTNSRGKTTTGVYSGVHWNVLAEAIGAQHARAVQVIASDGFEQVYPLEVLEAADSLFALYKDGEPITQDEGAGKVWFCASESYTANFWAKYIVKIVVR
jgi:hypothetical protein